MDINWTMVGAIGTCVGAAATFCAVLVALAQASKATKTSATVSFTVKTLEFWGREDDRDQTFIDVEIANVGLVPLSARSIMVNGALSGGRITFPVTDEHRDCGNASIVVSPGQVEIRSYHLWKVVLDKKSLTWQEG